MKTLREAREQKGMTGRAVAAAIGIAQSHLSEIEQGKRLPSPEEEDKLAEFFGGKIEYHPMAVIRREHDGTQAG